jgi:hypothetical protein
MGELALNLFFLVVIAGGVAAVDRRWVRPRRARLDLQGRAFLGFVTVASMVGFVGSPFWFLDLEQSFSWDLPPLASRMLAAAGVAFTVACVLTLRAPTPPRARLLLAMIATYMLPLTVAILLFHLDRFDPGAAITYGFFTVVVGVDVATLWFLTRTPVLAEPFPADAAPPGSTVSAWLAAIAVVTGLWGLALFVTDLGPIAALWVWPGDLLSSRLIGVMLLTIAVACGLGRSRSDTAAMALTVTITYAIGVIAAGLASVLFARPVPVAYVLAFAVFGIGSAVVGRIRRPTEVPATSA